MSRHGNWVAGSWYTWAKKMSKVVELVRTNSKKTQTPSLEDLMISSASWDVSFVFTHNLPGDTHSCHLRNSANIRKLGGFSMIRLSSKEKKCSRCVSNPRITKGFWNGSGFKRIQTAIVRYVTSKPWLGRKIVHPWKTLGKYQFPVKKKSIKSIIVFLDSTYQLFISNKNCKLDYPPVI
jgi:hypothetical protein